MPTNSQECPVCYESFQPADVTMCNGHVACCKKCLPRLRNNKCPICRKPILLPHYYTPPPPSTPLPLPFYQRIICNHLPFIEDVAAARYNQEQRVHHPNRIYLPQRLIFVERGGNESGGYRPDKYYQCVYATPSKRFHYFLELTDFYNTDLSTPQTSSLMSSLHYGWRHGKDISKDKSLNIRRFTQSQLFDNLLLLLPPQ